MSNLNSKYIVIDTETTGLSPSKHGLIQLAAIVLDKNLEIVDEFVRDVCPPDGFEMDDEATKIHGFSMDRIKSGISYKDVCIQFIDFIQANFKEKPVVVGQFYPFDYAFLEHVFSLTGYWYIMNRDLLDNKFIDTKSLALSLNLKAEIAGKEIPFKTTSLSKLGGLKDKLGITGDYKAHDALGDVLATREVLIKLLNYL